MVDVPVRGENDLLGEKRVRGLEPFPPRRVLVPLIVHIDIQVTFEGVDRGEEPAVPVTVAVAVAPRAAEGTARKATITARTSPGLISTDTPRRNCGRRGTSCTVPPLLCARRSSRSHSCRGSRGRTLSAPRRAGRDRIEPWGSWQTLHPPDARGPWMYFFRTSSEWHLRQSSSIGRTRRFVAFI